MRPRDVVEARGGDAVLGEIAVAHPGVPVHFVPDATSDLARCLGIREGRGSGEAIVDLLRFDGAATAVNMAVLGAPPDRLHWWHQRRRCTVEVDGRLLWEGPATTVVLANGEFLRRGDLVPRGHPGDGRFEVQVYALAPRTRRAMRARLARGEHVPHPEIHTASVTRAVVRFDQAVPIEVDGRRRPAARGLEAAIEPGALTLRF